MIPQELSPAQEAAVELIAEHENLDDVLEQTFGPLEDIQPTEAPAFAGGAAAIEIKDLPPEDGVPRQQCQVFFSGGDFDPNSAAHQMVNALSVFLRQQLLAMQEPEEAANDGTIVMPASQGGIVIAEA